jgi:hypothetical protein
MVSPLCRVVSILVSSEWPYRRCDNGGYNNHPNHLLCILGKVMWLKFSHQPIVHDPNLVWVQNDYRSSYIKPKGCWITDDSEDNWEQWCRAESWGEETLAHKHQVILNEEKILFLNSKEALDGFTRLYGVPQMMYYVDPKLFKDEPAIAWDAVANNHSGIIITPYIFERRFTDWYYGWDCASGCIWDAKAILEIRPC